MAKVVGPWLPACQGKTPKRTLPSGAAEGERTAAAACCMCACVWSVWVVGAVGVVWEGMGLAGKWASFRRAFVLFCLSPHPPTHPPIPFWGMPGNATSSTAAQVNGPSTQPFSPGPSASVPRWWPLLHPPIHFRLHLSFIHPPRPQGHKAHTHK